MRIRVLRGAIAKRHEKKPSGKTPRFVQIARNLGELIPQEELRRIPKDLSDQIDHYVYGTPKR
jgi:hypothetical protein